MNEGMTTDKSDKSKHGSSTQGQAGANFDQEKNKLVEEGKSTISGLAARKQEEAADRVHNFSSALNKAADDMAEQNGYVAGYMSDAAEQLSKVGDRIGQTDPRELMSEAEDVTRRHPALIIGAAAAAGFLFARFAQSSSNSGGGHSNANRNSGRSSQRPVSGRY